MAYPAAPFGQFYDGTLPSGWASAYAVESLVEGCYAELWSGMSPDHTGAFNNVLLQGPIKVVSGSITIDRNNAIRRRATNVTLDPSVNATFMIPAANNALAAFSAYAPYGNELRLFKGALVAGTMTYIPLGIFEISGVKVTNNKTGVTMNGTLQDRSSWISRRKFTFPFQIAFGTLAEIAIGEILIAAMGNSFLYTPYVYNYISTFWSVNTLSYKIGGDPWTACQDIAAAAGCQLYFDYAGELQLCKIPNGTGYLGEVAFPSPCASYLEGDIISAHAIDRVLDNEQIPNVVCVQSQGSNVAIPYQSFWWQSNNGLPLYYAPAPSGGFLVQQPILAPLAPGSQYPTCVDVISTSIINDPTGANAAYMALCAGELASATIEITTFNLRDQPAHDVDDVITAQRIPAGVVAPIFAPPYTDSVNYCVDSVVIDLSPKNDLQLIGHPIGAT